MDKKYQISVRSDDNYERLIAEIIFYGKSIGLIVSQEEPHGKFEISIFSLIDNPIEKFYETEKLGAVSLDLDVFLDAISAAKDRLLNLDMPRE